MTTRRKRIAENLLAVAARDGAPHDVQRDRHDRRERAARAAARSASRRSTACKLVVHAVLREGGVHGAQGVSDRQRADRRRHDRLQALREHGHRRRVATRGSSCRTSRTPTARAMLDISRDIVAVAKRARDGKLTMDDLTGGTFTITNGGVFGSLVSTPIINYPQVGILGLHKIAGPPGRDRRQGRDPADDVRRALVRPPHHRRPAGGAVPGAGQGADGRSGRRCSSSDAVDADEPNGIESNKATDTTKATTRAVRLASLPLLSLLLLLPLMHVPRYGPAISPGSASPR